MKLIIVDGVEGAGKSTLIRNLVAKTGGAVIDPQRGSESIDIEWVRTIEDSVNLFSKNMIVFMDRGLGSEFVFGPSRQDTGYEYRYKISELMSLSAIILSERSIEVHEVLLTCDKDVASERNGTPLKSVDTATSWNDWSSSLTLMGVDNIVIDTTRISTNQVLDIVHEKIWPLSSDREDGTIEHGLAALEVLLSLQRELMDAIGLDPESDRTLLAALAGIIGEGAESLQEITKNKPWKNNREHALEEEITDVLFFLLEAYICIGFTASDIMSFYRMKWNKNMKRLEAARAK